MRHGSLTALSPLLPIPSSQHPLLRASGNDQSTNAPLAALVDAPLRLLPLPWRFVAHGLPWRFVAHGPVAVVADWDFARVKVS
jgi:hypothetical protein